MYFGGIFDFERKKERLAEILIELENPKVWQKLKYTQNIQQEKKILQNLINTFEKLILNIKDSITLLDLVLEEKDKLTLIEIINEIKILDDEVKQLEFVRMFNNKIDQNNAFLDIQSGSGGTEAQDWSEMLMRMYLRFGESHGFKAELIEFSNGEITGIKGCTIHFKGNYAYGWLRTETGIHRLVRKSPFNSGNRRHTSFASVFVSPEIDETINITINPIDLRIDTYRSSGAGGQHVNRTDSAVRITHNPTGIVVQCQNNRSQHKNKAQAMKQLKSKIYEFEIQKRNTQKQAQENKKSNISWGSQIRSYILDQSRIKDIRTGIENTNTQSVLDGNIDIFIEESLKIGL